MSSVREKIASFKVEAWFLQHVKRWLEASTESAPKCVENALKQEEVWVSWFTYWDGLLICHVILVQACQWIKSALVFCRWSFQVVQWLCRLCIAIAMAKRGTILPIPHIVIQGTGRSALIYYIDVNTRSWFRWLPMPWNNIPMRLKVLSSQSLTFYLVVDHNVLHHPLCYIRRNVLLEAALHPAIKYHPVISLQR